MELDEMMQVFYRQAEKQVVPDLVTKQAMTAAGAKVLADQLRENTPRSNKKNPKYGHLQDNVGFEASDIDGEANGNSVVGFGKKAYIARFLNDGTIKMKATHFVDNTRRQAATEVFKAQQAIYEAKRGGKA